MKSVLISIQPKWCELIASGEKTIEVRKTRPKIDTPFRCYIYRTKGTYSVISNGKWTKPKTAYGVIGEFVCDKIDNARCDNLIGAYYNNCTAATGLEDWEIVKYSDGKLLYFWHISDLTIYDKPKELREFSRECKSCPLPYLYMAPCDKCGAYKINQPPQSWCYIDELL